jgi:hypothetical protein
MADCLEGVEGTKKSLLQKNCFSIKEKGEWSNAKRSNVINNTNHQISNPNFQKKFGTPQFSNFKKFSGTQSNFKHNATRDQKGPKCFACNKYGHLSYDCPQPTRFSNKSKKEINSMDKKSIPMTSKVEEISMLEQSVIHKDEMQLPVQFAVKRCDQSRSSTRDTIDNMILTNAVIKEIKGTHPLPKVYGFMKRKLILSFLIRAQHIILYHKKL